MSEVRQRGVIFCSSRMGLTPKGHNRYRFYCCCPCMKISQGISLISCSVLLVWASILMTDDILYQAALDFQEFNIISGTLTASTSEDTTLRKKKKILMLLLIWQCFSCNLIYEESLTSLTNLLGCSRGPLEKSQSFF